MRLLPHFLAATFLVGLGAAPLALQRNAFDQFQRYGGYEDRGYNTQSNDKAEFTWSRLHYNDSGRRFGGFRRGSWSTDYPKADRQFLFAFKRLTRIDARPTEQIVDLDSDDIYNWPFVYAVQVESWSFSPTQAARMREYLLKGGFLMVDDFHGTADWESFMAGMRMVFPDRPVEELADNDEMFHVLYDLGQRFQVPGEQYVSTGRTYENDGFVPHWRAIRDDNGRVVVAICYNMHLGDAWEWADDPRYPERFASLAFRVGIDYIAYSMTH